MGELLFEVDTYITQALSVNIHDHSKALVAEAKARAKQPINPETVPAPRTEEIRKASSR